VVVKFKLTDYLIQESLPMVSDYHAKRLLPLRIIRPPRCCSDDLPPKRCRSIMEPTGDFTPDSIGPWRKEIASA
jgi:hypothetical protein